MNAESGEILAISTYPFFNANQLEENWENWSNNENAPFLNRATQGTYPIGGLLSSFLLYEQDINLIKDFNNSKYSQMTEILRNANHTLLILIIGNLTLKMDAFQHFHK